MLGLGIVLLTLQIGRLFCEDSLWQVIPGVFVTTLPQFIFNCAYINNDPLNNLFTTAAIYYGLRLITAKQPDGDALRLGLYTGLSLCTKKTGLFL